MITQKMLLFCSTPMLQGRQGYAWQCVHATRNTCLFARAVAKSSSGWIVLYISDEPCKWSTYSLVSTWRPVPVSKKLWYQGKVRAVFPQPSYVSGTPGRHMTCATYCDMHQKQPPSLTETRRRHSLCSWFFIRQAVMTTYFHSAWVVRDQVRKKLTTSKTLCTLLHWIVHTEQHDCCKLHWLPASTHKGTCNNGVRNDGPPLESCGSVSRVHAFIETRIQKRKKNHCNHAAFGIYAHTDPIVLNRVPWTPGQDRVPQSAALLGPGAVAATATRPWIWSSCVLRLSGFRVQWHRDAWWETEHSGFGQQNLGGCRRWALGGRSWLLGGG